MRPRRRRAAIVGTGSRAQLFTRGLAQRARYTVAALCDPSPTRMAYHNRLLIKAGNGAASLWPPGAFTEMLAAEGITDVVVSTVDALHDRYIVPALEAGCRVVTEKPMTVDAAKCRSILDATSRTGNPLTVAFNYRYNPVHERPGDAARQSASQRDGALALAVGIAANECFLTGQPVRVADLIVPGEPRADGGYGLPR